MLDKFVAGVPDLLAEILQEQRRTNDLFCQLVEAINAKSAPVAAAKVETTKAIENAQTAAAYSEQKAVKAEPKAEATASASDYDTAAKRVTSLAGAKGREAAVAVLDKFGAKTLKGIDANKYAEVIAACDEAMA